MFGRGPVSEIPKIRAMMTATPRSIDADSLIQEAQQLMERRGIRHLPVTNGDCLVGVVTDRDVKHSLDPVFDVPPMAKVRSVMTTDPYVVGPDEPLDSVLLTMAQRRIGCTLVADGDKLVGIFTTTDALRSAGHFFREMREGAD
jgi:acetoin utilization protein AcuB